MVKGSFGFLHGSPLTPDPSPALRGERGEILISDSAGVVIDDAIILDIPRLSPRSAGEWSGVRGEFTT